MKHVLLMLACCLVPLGLLAVVPALGIDLGGGIGLVVIALMCPLMMIVMMMGMRHDHTGHEHADSDHESHSPSCHGDNRTAGVEPKVTMPLK